MKHLIIRQTAKGATVKCGAFVKRRDEYTMWYSDVDCPQCRPFRFMPVPADDPIGGMKMVYVGEGPEPPNGSTEPTPVVKPKRRIVRTPRA
jgi:hypothetical protein